MNMLVVNGQLYSHSRGARSTTLVPVLQKWYCACTESTFEHLLREESCVANPKYRFFSLLKCMLLEWPSNDWDP